MTQRLFIRRVASAYKRTKSFPGFARLGNVPFRRRAPALAEFPAKLWRRMANRRVQHRSALIRWRVLDRKARLATV
jgi:hypothetical protein